MMDNLPAYRRLFLEDSVSLFDDLDGWAAQTAARLAAWVAAHPGAYPPEEWPRLYGNPKEWTEREVDVFDAIFLGVAAAFQRDADGGHEYGEFLRPLHPRPE